MTRRKRVADIMEKLGVAGVALGIFQSSLSGFIWGMIFLVISIILTPKG